MSYHCNTCGKEHATGEICSLPVVHCNCKPYKHKWAQEFLKKDRKKKKEVICLAPY